LGTELTIEVLPLQGVAVIVIEPPESFAVLLLGANVSVPLELPAGVSDANRVKLFVDWGCP